MSSGGWKEYVSKRDRGVRFDILEGRYLRLRARNLGRGDKKAYLVIDLLTLTELEIELYQDGKMVDVIYLLSEKTHSPSTEKEVRELRA